VLHAGGSLCFCGDALFNTPHQPGAKGFILRLIGSSGGPRVTLVARLALVESMRDLRAHFAELSAMPGLARLVPCHGWIVDREPAAALRSL
jgi:glyoxylase-like metal-dependent hydrolase (beta-lactamase superfamily II)